MIDYTTLPRSTPPHPVDEHRHDSAKYEGSLGEAGVPGPVVAQAAPKLSTPRSSTPRHPEPRDQAALRDRMHVPPPGERNRPLPRLTINRRSGDSDNVEETILKLYHADRLMQQPTTAVEPRPDRRTGMPEISLQYRHVVGQIESWRKRPLTKLFRYVFLTGVELTGQWGCERKQASILTAVGVDEFGVREVLGVAEAATDPVSSWLEFLQQLKRRGLFGVCLFIGDRHEGLANRLATLFPGAQYQNSTAQFQRDLLALVPAGSQSSLARKMDAIFSSPDWPAAKQLISDMSAELNHPELAAAAGFFAKYIWESMNHVGFPKLHRHLLQSNRAQLELLHGKGEQARAIGTFPDGLGAVLLVSARLRHIEAKVWNEKCVAPGC